MCSIFSKIVHSSGANTGYRPNSKVINIVPGVPTTMINTYKGNSFLQFIMKENCSYSIKYVCFFYSYLPLV